MEIYPQLIIDALSTVRYPGTGKNVVEMKMVEDDLRIAGLHVSFSLIFDKPTDPFMKSMVKACEAAIHAYVSKDVEVEIKTKSLQAPRLLSMGATLSIWVRILSWLPRWWFLTFRDCSPRVCRPV